MATSGCWEDAVGAVAFGISGTCDGKRGWCSGLGMPGVDAVCFGGIRLGITGCFSTGSAPKKILAKSLSAFL
eukprot:13103995-Ditylum_brightwellii.AAC.1